jgi:glutamine amidotransferase
MKVVVVDYGVGNVNSIKNILNKISCKDVLISNEKKDIEEASKLILPGVGSFDTAISNLHKLDLFDLLNEKVLNEKVPILGICLGMQVMTKSSEEGDLDGFGWFDHKTVKFKFSSDSYKAPNMGWLDVTLKKESRIFEGLEENARFYFVHSYHVDEVSKDDVILTANYENNYTIGIEKDNIIGVQFHPEKSHKFGMKLLSNFINNY